jgi:hypothetical protein
VNVLIGTVAATPNCTGLNWSISIDATTVGDGSVTITADHADSLGNSASQALVSINKDASIPNPATGIAWLEGTSSTTVNISANWTAGGSIDVASQTVNFYNDGTCSGAVASSNSETSAATSSSFVGTDGANHSFIVVSIDGAGNSSSSVCSNAIFIDSTPPIAASTVSWAEGTSSTVTSINANWTLGGSTDVASHRINFYNDGTCSGVVASNN